MGGSLTKIRAAFKILLSRGIKAVSARRGGGGGGGGEGGGHYIPITIIS